MYRSFLGLLGFCLMAICSAQAEPVVKVINFTADWCPNCQILNPRLDEAIAAFEEGSIERVDLDVTAIRRDTSLIERGQIETDLLRLAEQHHVAHLWNEYGGVTGIAVAVAADNGESLYCFMRPMTSEDIRKRLYLAKILAEKAQPDTRKMNGTNCPVLK